ncbi:uridine kinase family protein [Cellulomonas sp. URHB0016]
MTSTYPDPVDALPLLADLIRRSGRSPVLVGIDGQGGAGKSRLARHLVACVPRSVVVEGDDFYRDMPDAARRLLDAEQGAEEYFDWERLRREVLRPVARGEPVLRYQRYDWGHAAMGGWVEMPMPDVVVVEGVYTLRPQLRDLVDVKVYVEASAQVRRQRQHDRGENPDHWIERWIAAEDAYVARTAPREAADVVVRSG